MGVSGRRNPTTGNIEFTEGVSRNAEILREAKRVLAQERASLFVKLLKREGIQEPESEWVFHPTRKWRFDFAWPAKKLALEIEGGVWTNGRHNRGTGFVNDMEKYNSAALLGWRLLRTTPTRLANLETIAMIKASLSPLSPSGHKEKEKA